MSEDPSELQETHNTSKPSLSDGGYSGTSRMATCVSYRLQAVRGRRSLRRRRDSEEENICLDMSKDPAELLQEILSSAVKRDVNKSRKLGYLNGLVKLCNKFDHLQSYGFSYRDIFCCLRVSLFHESCEVRAAGLRACRYLLLDVEALEAFLQLQLHLLVSRSLDLLLDNQQERIQALRLMRKILCAYPLSFPRAFISCLVAVCNESIQERDIVRACVATLAQLSLLNPEACVKTKVVSALLRNVFDCYQPNISEAILGVLQYLFNNPKTRDLIKDDLGLEHLLAPFTDCHYRYPCEIFENAVNSDREVKMTFSKLAVVAVLRSWSGITYMCRPDHSHLQSLVEVLYLPYFDIRKNIVDMLYEIFNMSVPEWTDDFSLAACVSDPSAFQNMWQLYEGYVVAEGTSILPYICNQRMNLIQNYFSLLLLVFVEAGILTALAEVIISSEVHLSVRATVLLGQLLYLSNQLLPLDCSHHCNCLPSLIAAAASFKSSQEQNQASAAVSCLCRIHELKKRSPIPYSLALDHLLYVCNPERRKKSFFSSSVSRAKLWHYLKKDISDMADHAIRNSLVLTKEYHSWDWDLIDSVLKNPSDAIKKMEEANHRLFIRRLLLFFRPSSKQFSEMEYDKDRERQICVTGCHFLEFLLDVEEAKSKEYLEDFLMDLNDCLIQVAKDSHPLNMCLSPTKLLSNFSHAYFLFIGRLSSSRKGCKFLSKFNTFQNLLHLVSVTNQDTLIKLIVSTLDYSKEGFSRTILSKVLTGTPESARLYATNYLRVLLRAGLVDFQKWVIEFLVTQLYDCSRLVSNAAVDILDEACNVQENLEALISLRPSLLHLGDKGLLLLIRFLSVPSGFRFLRDSNFLLYEIQRWQKVYNLKYVKIVEDLLNEALTRHRRGEDGIYGRRSSDMKHVVQDVYLPHHVYGQLVQHPDGVDVLMNEINLSDLFAVIYSSDCSSDLKVLRLKAALWAVGHVGSYRLGFPLINADIIPHIVQLAAEAPVLTIRGTCYNVLGLLSCTPEGSLVLSELGWETVKHTFGEKWPLVKDNLIEEEYLSQRIHAWSLSSSGSEHPHNSLLMNLYLPLRSSDPPLSASVSSQSLNSDQVECSTSNHNMKLLPNENKKSDSGHSCVRISPSSEPAWLEDSGELLNVNEHQWKQLAKDRSNSFNCSQNSNNVILKERSSSSGEQVELREENEIDSIYEISTDSESKSRSDTTSPMSGGNLYDLKPFSFESNKPLDPINSHMFGDPSLRTDGESAERPSLLRHLSHSQSCYLHSPVSPEGNSVFTFTSAQDARGYFALKDIQRRRVQSLSFQGSHNYEPEMDIRHSKSQVLGTNQSALIDSLSLNDEQDGSVNFTSNRTATEDPEGNIVAFNDSSNDDVRNVRFIGVCLPAHFGLIFHVPKNLVPTCEGSPSDNNKASSKSGIEDIINVGLEFHTISNCLISHILHGAIDLLGEKIEEESEELSPESVMSSGDSCENTKNIYITREVDHSPKGSQRYSEEGPEWKYMVRKEVMRCVTNLCSSMAVKQSEQGLLSLKQKFPSAFQDVCLYTEISLHMAEYHFRLTARRFLQELFLDATFEQLQREAEAVIGIVSLSQLSNSEA